MVTGMLLLAGCSSAVIDPPPILVKLVAINELPHPVKVSMALWSPVDGDDRGKGCASYLGIVVIQPGESSEFTRDPCDLAAWPPSDKLDVTLLWLKENDTINTPPQDDRKWNVAWPAEPTGATFTVTIARNGLWYVPTFG